MRWQLIVGAFEALIKTSRSDVTWQFKDRVSRLAIQFGTPLTENDLERAYELRSRLVHGEEFLSAMGGTVPVQEQDDPERSPDGQRILRPLQGCRFIGSALASASQPKRRAQTKGQEEGWRMSMVDPSSAMQSFQQELLNGRMRLQRGQIDPNLFLHV